MLEDGSGNTRLLRYTDFQKEIQTANDQMSTATRKISRCLTGWFGNWYDIRRRIEISMPSILDLHMAATRPLPPLKSIIH
jgi:hypothetical protein